MENKFSVLMSVYYKENPEYFDLSLESCLIKQTLRPTEFVLICDGDLTSELETVIKKYQLLFPDVFKVYRKENGGLGKALNFGVPLCSYEFIARADSDDVCADDRFEKQIEFFASHSDISVLGSYVDGFKDNWKEPYHTKKTPLTDPEIKQMMTFRNPLCHPTVMFKKSSILKVGSYRDALYVEDYDLWVRCMIDGIKFANIDQVLVHARVGNGMAGRRSSKKQIHGWYVINNNLIKNKKISLLTYCKNMVSIILFVYTPISIKEQLYKNILRKKL